MNFSSSSPSPVRGLRSSSDGADVAAGHESGSRSDRRRSRRPRSHRSRRSWQRKLARRFDRLVEQLESVPFYGLLFLLVMLPLVYNGGDYWWLPTASCLLALLYAIWGLAAWWRGSESVRWRWHAGILLFVLPLTLGLVQFLPLPDGVARCRQSAGHGGKA